MRRHWRIWYAFQEWKCRHFGHKAYWEARCSPPAHCCKRGCGPA